MNQEKKRVVLITGSNTGIGNATARRAVEAGYITYGGARREASFPAVAAVGAHPLCIDVTDEDSMTAAVRQIEAEHGAVDILINNAGFGQMGPVEDITRAQWLRQYDTNVFGLVRMAQLVIPGMRRQGWGRILNISSMGGEFTFPLAGAYHSTKYAVELINDAMRFELRPFGIDVISIQPAAVETPLATQSAETLHALPDSPYAAIIDRFQKMSRSSIRYIAPDAVAAVIIDAATARRPRPRYKIGLLARVLPTARALLSDRQWDALLGRLYGA